MLLKRSWCWCQLGEMKKAILDAEECSTMQVQGLEEETLVAMAKLYESVEDYQKALDCLRVRHIRKVLSLSFFFVSL